MKRNVVTLSFLLTVSLMYGQSGTDFRELQEIKWESTPVFGGHCSQISRNKSL